MPDAKAVWDAVFVDRDGTLNAPSAERYITRPADLELIDGAAEAVRSLNGAGVVVVVVTNQQGVGTGWMTEQALADVHARLAELLAEGGASLDAIYVCPHRAGSCSCRKPADGLIRQALADRPELRPSRCAIVGDSVVDVQAGASLGLTRVLLRASGEGGSEADHTSPDLRAAVSWLLACRAPS